MKKYTKKKLALGGGMDKYDALDAVVGSPSPTTTSAIGAGLISKVPNQVSATGPTMAGAAKGGGGMSAGGYQAAAALGTGLMDVIDGGNQYGNQSSGVTIGKGALTGAAAGATVGSVIPGIGTAIGAAGGAIIGGVTGLINAKKIKKKERRLFADQNVARNKYDNAVSNALATDQGLVEGYKGASYFKMGGKILGRGLKYALGGPIKGIPVRDLPTDNRRLRNIDSLATAWKVPTTSIMTTGLYNYGDTKANGGIPRRMDYIAPGHQFYDYYDDVTRGTGSMARPGAGLAKFKKGGKMATTPLDVETDPIKRLKMTSVKATAELNRPTDVVKKDIGVPGLSAQLSAQMVTSGDFKPGEAARKNPGALTKEGKAAEIKRLKDLGYKGDKLPDLQKQKATRDSIVNEGTRVNAMKANELRGALPMPRNAAQMVAKRVFGESRMDKNSLSDNEKIVLYNTMKNAEIRTGKTQGGTEYEDYQGEWGSKEDFNNWFNKGGVSIGNLIGKSVGNTGFKVASTVGRGKFYRDPETGDMVYTDVYDWNTHERNFKEENLYQKLRNSMRGSEDTTLTRDKNETSRMNFILPKREMDSLIIDRARREGLESKAMGGQLARPGGGLLNGPSISSQPTVGGEAEPLNSQSTEIVGNSHTQGGVQIPQLGAEVENGETTTGNFVFSKELGFAKLHRPIAKAIGKIEKKPQTADRRNALQLLKGQEERLALSQEQYKLQNGMQ